MKHRRLIVGISCLLATAMGIWFCLEALSGVFMYTTQGDLCGNFERAFRAGRPVDQVVPLLRTCGARNPSVYHAFLVELAAGVVLIGFGARALWLAAVSRRRRRSGRA